MHPSPLRVACAALFLSACSLELAGAGLDPDASTGLDSGPGHPFDGGRDGGPTDGGHDSTIGPGIDAAAGSCDDGTPSGGTQTQDRYEHAFLKDTRQCRKEEQTRTCNQGVWTAWSGTFMAENCEQAPFDSCGSTPHGQYAKRTCYEQPVVSSYGACRKIEETALCEDGELDEWSGDCEHTSCVVGFLGACNTNSNVACASGTTCAAGLLGGAGTCLGLKGSPCEANNQCSGELTCINKVCADESGPAAACDDANDCNDLACIGLLSSEAMACVGGQCRCANGSNCLNDNQCQGTCVGTVGVLATIYTTGARCVTPNSTCDNGDDCRDGRACANTSSGRRCVIPDGMACLSNASCASTCRGGLCAPFGTPASMPNVCEENADCASPYVCRDAQCAELGGLLASCDEPADCGSFTVLTLSSKLTCASLKVCLAASGQPCAANEQCASNKCVDSNPGPGPGPGNTTKVCQ